MSSRESLLCLLRIIEDGGDSYQPEISSDVEGFLSVSGKVNSQLGMDIERFVMICNSNISTKDFLVYQSGRPFMYIVKRMGLYVVLLYPSKVLYSDARLLSKLNGKSITDLSYHLFSQVQDDNSLPYTRGYLFDIISQQENTPLNDYSFNYILTPDQLYDVLSSVRLDIDFLSYRVGVEMVDLFIPYTTYEVSDGQLELEISKEGYLLNINVYGFSESSPVYSSILSSLENSDLTIDQVSGLVSQGKGVQFRDILWRSFMSFMQIFRGSYIVVKQG